MYPSDLLVELQCGGTFACNALTPLTHTVNAPPIAPSPPDINETRPPRLATCGHADPQTAHANLLYIVALDMILASIIFITREVDSVQLRFAAIR